MNQLDPFFDYLDDECVSIIYHSWPDVFTLALRRTCRRMRNLFPAPAHMTLAEFALSATRQNCATLLEFAIRCCVENDKRLTELIQNGSIPSDRFQPIVPSVDMQLMVKAVELHRTDLFTYFTLELSTMNKYKCVIKALAKHGPASMLFREYITCLTHDEIDEITPGLQTKYLSKEWFHRLDLFEKSDKAVSQYLHTWLNQFTMPAIVDVECAFEFFIIFTYPQLKQYLTRNKEHAVLYYNTLKSFLKTHKQFEPIVAYLVQFC